MKDCNKNAWKKAAAFLYMTLAIFSAGIMLLLFRKVKAAEAAEKEEA